MNLDFGSLYKLELPLKDNLYSENLNHLPENLSSATDSRKIEFIAGRICAQRAAKALDFELTELKVGEKREPLWPEGLVGSITHTKGICFALVDRAKSSRSVGIDIEGIVPDSKFETIERMIVNEKELGILKLFGDKNLAYTVVFSAKEALYKLIYPLAPVFFGFHEARVVSLDLDLKQFTLRLESEKPELKPYLGIYSGCFQVLDGRVLSILRLSAN